MNNTDSPNKEKPKTKTQKKPLTLRERLSLYEKALPYKTKRDERVDAAWDSVKPVGKEIL